MIRDINFPVNIPHDKFFECIFAIMAVDPVTAELGWRSNDEPKFGPVHHLATDNSDALEGAFRTLLKKMNQSRRQEDVIMEIKHLVRFACKIQQLTNSFYRTLLQSRPKGGRVITNWAADSVYRAELCLIQQKFFCAVHAGPNRWCYKLPEKPDEHIALGYEEICLWARSIVRH